MKRVNNQCGMTLLEVLVSLGILSAVMVGSASLIDSYATNMKLSVVGQHMNMFGQAMQAYLRDKYRDVSDAAQVGQPYVITVEMLTAAVHNNKYLPSGFESKNSYQQTICGLVLKTDQGQLNGLVVTEGGKPINDVDLGQVAGIITAGGGAGGGIYSGDAYRDFVVGAMNGWRVPVSDYYRSNRACGSSTGAVSLEGHPAMALWYSGGDATSAYLYRHKIPGHHQLNQMQTDIDMNSNILDKASRVNTGTLNATSDATVGGILDVSGVATMKNTLDVSGVATMKNALDVTGVAKMRNALEVSGVATMKDKLDVEGNTTLNGTLNVERNTMLKGDLNTLTSPLNALFAKNAEVTDTLKAAKLDGYLQIISGAVAGADCGPSGMIAAGDGGILLACEGGKWRAPNRSNTFRQVVGPVDLESVVQCNADEVVVSGGGTSEDGFVLGPKRGFLHTSVPHGNGWAANAYGYDWSQDVLVQAYAICMKAY